MLKQKEQPSLAVEIISDIRTKLIVTRIALGLSLAGNVILAAVLVFG